MADAKFYANALTSTMIIWRVGSACTSSVDLIGQCMYIKRRIDALQSGCVQRNYYDIATWQNEENDIDCSTVDIRSCHKSYFMWDLEHGNVVYWPWTAGYALRFPQKSGMMVLPENTSVVRSSSYQLFRTSLSSSKISDMVICEVL